MISVSRPVRLAIKQEFAGQFNARIAQACTTFGVDPFTIDFSAPGNYYEGPVVLDFLLDYLQENPAAIPAVCLFSEGPSSEGFTHPQQFSGVVNLGGAVFLRYTLDTVDFESLVEAVEAAILGMLHESETDAWGGATYRDDVRFRFGDLVFENGQFYRAVQFQLSFQV